MTFWGKNTHHPPKRNRPRKEIQKYFEVSLATATGVENILYQKIFKIATIGLFWHRKHFKKQLEAFRDITASL